MKVSKITARMTASLMIGAAMFSFTACTNEDDGKLSDAQIASVAVVANQIDIDYGNIALTKSSDQEAIKFAQTMIDDHQGIIDAAVELVGKLGVTPDDNNDVTKSLQDGAKAMKEKLNGLEGKEFNKAYISNEVDYHEAVIDAVRNVLIPQAENEELKATLESIMPLLEHHLEMAKEAKDAIENEPEVPTLTDAQIASIAVVANQIDVDYGNIALEKSTSEEATKFAQTMVDDHQGIINTAVELAGKLGVTPDNDNPVTKSLLEGAEKMKATLNGLEGEEFNKAYINNEVTYHEAAIDLVTNVLIPQTENSELKETLVSVSPLFVHHLEMAKEAQAKLSE